jgi:apolipoprotein D and lipocalin family protein
MKRTFALVAMALIGSALLSTPAVAMGDELKTVPFVDPAKFIGTWYQIAHKPQFFEGGTCACARQKLSNGDNGVLNVYNSCNDGNPAGKLKEIRGIATNDNTTTNAKWSIDFNLPWKGTYWIIALDPNYNWAVVSDKLKMSLYILSKNPTLDEASYKEAFNQAAQQLDTSEVKLTYQKDCTYPQ